MDWLLRVILFLLGLVFGSFINMLVYRTALKYGLIRRKFKVIGKSRSVCDYCGKQLAWFDNIPVISWLFLGGKSRCCREKLPLTYPMVEAGMGILLAMFFWEIEKIIINPYFFVLEMLILVLLVFSLVFDAKYMILPDFSNLLLVLGALILAVLKGEGLAGLLLSGMGSGLFLLALHVGTRGKGMGMGDVKLAVFMGLFLGWQKTVLAYYVAFIVGAVVGVSLMILGKVGRKTEIPFGPYLILGVGVAWVWGEKLIGIIK